MGKLRTMYTPKKEESIMGEYIENQVYRDFKRKQEKYNKQFKPINEKKKPRSSV